MRATYTHDQLSDFTEYVFKNDAGEVLRRGRDDRRYLLDAFDASALAIRERWIPSTLYVDGVPAVRIEMSTGRAPKPIRTVLERPE